MTAANTKSLESGYLETIDNQIDTTTGTVKLRATFDNQESMLFPNQFVNTKLLVDVIKDATIVPTPAVLNGSIGRVRLCGEAGQYGDRAQREDRSGRW